MRSSPCINSSSGDHHGRNDISRDFCASFSPGGEAGFVLRINVAIQSTFDSWVTFRVLVSN